MTDDATPPIAKYFTIPGRLLLISTLLGTGGAVGWYVSGTFGDFPSGRYPLLLWAIPVGIGAFFFFLAAAWTLEKLGVPIYTRPKKDGD